MFDKLLKIINYSFLQVVVQGLSFFLGLLLIRFFDKNEYAIYVVCNSILGTISVLGDSGISNAVMSIGGQNWKNKDKMGQIIYTANNLRLKFAVVSIFISIPIFYFLLNKQNVSYYMMIILFLSLIPSVFSTFTNSILETILKLNQNLKPLFVNQIQNNVFRIISILSLVFIFPLSFVVLLLNGIIQYYTNLRLRNISSKYFNEIKKNDLSIQKQILAIVKRTLPGSIYYCISGQVTIWLVSLFGSTDSIANVGAIARVTVVFSIISLLINKIIEPRFARLPNNRTTVVNQFLFVQLIILILSFLIIIFSYLLSDYMYIILGEKYNNLGDLFIIMVISSCIQLFSSTTFKLSSSRGVIPKPLYFIPLLVLIQLGYIYFIDVSTIKGALFFTITTFMGSWIFRMIYFLYYNFKYVSKYEKKITS
jgi:O-antigen/teichoic acid export membrane protein